jgi:hypothetical protein
MKDKVKNLIVFVVSLLILHAILFFPAHGSPSAIVTINGTVTGPDGTPLNGRMVLTLSNPGQNTANNTAVAVYPIQYPVVNGSLPSFAAVVPNDAIQPMGTYYVENLYDTAGNPVAQNNFYITSPGPFNIGQATPTSLTTNQISFQSPAFVNINNIWQGTQTFNGLAWTSGTTFSSNLLNSNTAVRNYTFPDASGIVCISTSCPTLANVMMTNTDLEGITSIGNAQQTTFASSGQLSQYETTTGAVVPTIGFPVFVNKGAIPTLCGTAGAVTIGTAPISGAAVFHLYYNMFTLSAGSAGTFSLTLKWTDGSGTLQSVASSTISLATLGSLQQGGMVAFPAATQNVTLQYTNTSGAGSPTCQGVWYLEEY